VKKRQDRATRRNAARQRRSRSTATENQIPIEAKTPKHRRFLKLVEWILGPPLALLGFVYAVWGPPWPMQPVFEAGAPSFGYAFAVPFKVSNKSGLFGLNNLHIRCGLVAQVRGEPPGGGTINFGSPGHPTFMDVQGQNGHLAAGDTASYTCPFAMLRISAGPNSTIRFAEMLFEREYDSPWPWGGRKIVRSPTSVLDLSTVPPQWKPAPLK
jgi:hypothetical protein